MKCNVMWPHSMMALFNAKSECLIYNYFKVEIWPMG